MPRSTPIDSARFNPRPREGATQRTAMRSAIASCFNPRPREGATVSELDRPVMLRAFQSTPP